MKNTGYKTIILDNPGDKKPPTYVLRIYIYTGINQDWTAYIDLETTLTWKYVVDEVKKNTTIWYVSNS